MPFTLHLVTFPMFRFFTTSSSKYPNKNGRKTNMLKSLTQVILCKKRVL